jgi:ribosome biogenesis GTPase A
MKIISLGFFNTTLENQKAYIFQLWNFADFFIIIMALIDIIYYQPRHDGMLNAFKSIKSFHLLTLMKKNDLMEIIINTMFRSIKPIMVALTLTISFIFVYSLVGVNFFRG